MRAPGCTLRKRLRVTAWSCGRMWSCSPISSSCFSASGAPSSTISTAGYSHHRRYPHLCGYGLLGCLERAGEFPVGREQKPTEVSGIPPDYFSADGQLWGNPLYDYEAMRKNGFEWWHRRIGGATKLYDVIRIDHFRGFESYWSVPCGKATAKDGHWVKGPSISRVGVLTSWFHDAAICPITTAKTASAIPALMITLPWPFGARRRIGRMSPLPHSIWV